MTVSKIYLDQSIDAHLQKLMEMQQRSDQAKLTAMQAAAQALSHPQMIAGQYGGPATPPPRAVPSLEEQLRVRMRWANFGDHKFHTLATRMTEEKAFVWVITHEGKSVVLEDDKDLYPSDSLVTQLRVLGA